MADDHGEKKHSKQNFIREKLRENMFVYYSEKKNVVFPFCDGADDSRMHIIIQSFILIITTTTTKKKKKMKTK